MWRLGDGEQTIGLEERTLDFMSWRDLKLCHHPLCFKVQFTEHSLAKCRYSTKWIRKKRARAFWLQGWIGGNKVVCEEGPLLGLSVVQALQALGPSSLATVTPGHVFKSSLY